MRSNEEILPTSVLSIEVHKNIVEVKDAVELTTSNPSVEPRVHKQQREEEERK